jgi:hypothetical protein
MKMEKSINNLKMQRKRRINSKENTTILVFATLLLFIDYFNTVHFDMDRVKLHWQTPSEGQDHKIVNLKNYVLIPHIGE